MKNIIKIFCLLCRQRLTLRNRTVNASLNLNMLALIVNIGLPILVLLFTMLPLYSSDTTPVKDYFSISKEVSDNIEFDKDIKVFFEYSDAYYTLPGGDQPTDIFRDPEAWDPLECYNRVMFSFNIHAANWVIQPLAMTYSFIIPKYVREGIRRMDGNIQTPGRLINSLLQAKFERAGIELARFGVNTTMGILGFYDPAYTWLNIEPRIIDFGQTFAYWGIEKGFYLILPVLGSTCLRDGVGLVGDYFTNPITWIPPYTFWNWISWGIKFGLGFNNMTFDLENYLRICQSSVDPYETVKMAWTILENLKNARDAMD
jgi:phospholipid-binding lipoprotein MlaA